MWIILIDRNKEHFLNTASINLTDNLFDIIVN